MAGRTTLIKATLNYLPNHLMQFAKIPRYITQLLEKYQRDFLWRTTPQKKLHLIKWKIVQLEKKDGGLGIPNLIHKNHALLGA